MQLAFAHYRVGEVQSVELYLAWSEIVDIIHFAVHLFKEVDELVVQWAVRNELQGADGVRYALKVVALSVCKVVHGVGIPLCSRAMVRRMDDAIHDWVAEVHVGIGHI